MSLDAEEVHGPTPAIFAPTPVYRLLFNVTMALSATIRRLSATKET